jgi:hypothetical protein
MPFLDEASASAATNPRHEMKRANKSERELEAILILDAGKRSGE